MNKNMKKGFISEWRLPWQSTSCVLHLDKNVYILSMSWVFPETEINSTRWTDLVKKSNSSFMLFYMFIVICRSRKHLDPHFLFSGSVTGFSFQPPRTAQASSTTSFHQGVSPWKPASPGLNSPKPLASLQLKFWPKRNHTCLWGKGAMLAEVVGTIKTKSSICIGQNGKMLEGTPLIIKKPVLKMEKYNSFIREKYPRPHFRIGSWGSFLCTHSYRKWEATAGQKALATASTDSRPWIHPCDVVLPPCRIWKLWSPGRFHSYLKETVNIIDTTAGMKPKTRKTSVEWRDDTQMVEAWNIY